MLERFEISKIKYMKIFFTKHQFLAKKHIILMGNLLTCVCINID